MATQKDLQEEAENVLREIVELRRRCDSRILSVMMLHYAAELISDLLMLKEFNPADIEAEFKSALENALRSREGEPLPKVGYKHTSERPAKLS